MPSDFAFRDPSIWCISSWNDNGFEHIAQDAARLMRTSYFPGLGWLMKSELWSEVPPLLLSMERCKVADLSSRC